ncbi:MAG: restriction endonuclease subunit S [Nanoarchaeota archaeon]|nr:restriction endonuclease subunit S [Nanoarchaeota archaeon]
MIQTIDELFTVQYGQPEYETKEALDEGNTILIASGGLDNGVYGFCNIPPFFKDTIISVPRTGSIGQAFVQQVECCVSSDALVLIPRKKMDLETLFQIAYQIRRIKWKFCYGRKITPDRLKREKIRIESSKIDYKLYSKKYFPKTLQKEKIKLNGKMKLVPLIDLCDIERKTAIPQNAMALNGKIPYVTTSSKDNGVSEFVSEEPNSKGKCLTVALNGSCGQVFFQFDDFITSGDNAILKLKESYNPHLLFYIGYQVYHQKWGFNYYRKLSEVRLRKFMIPMPINKKGEYDFEFIEKLVKNCFGYEDLKKFF